MMGDCRRTNEQLVPYVDGVLPKAEHADVERHLAQCPPCRRSAAAIDGGRRVLREAGVRLKEPLPPGLRSRCEALTHETRTAPSPWRRRLLPAVAIALIVVSTVGVLMAMATERSNVLLAQQLVLDHVKCLLFPADASDGSAAAAQLLVGQYAKNVQVPPSSSSAGVTLVGARRCLYISGVIQHVMYRAGGRNLSLFVLDGVTRARSDIPTFGYRARIWSEGGRSFVLVAERDDPDPAGAAQYLMQQIH